MGRGAYQNPGACPAGEARALYEVRNTPAMAIWFETGDSGLAAHASRGAETVDELAAAFVARLLGDEGGGPSRLTRTTR